jgi:hypothetical protein
VPEDVSQQAEEAEEAEDAVADVDSYPDERTEMEARYNGGDPVERSVSVGRLRLDDILYVGDDLILVVRRERVGLKRYWLEGDLDLDREELEKQGNSRYRVRRVIR